jgi:hypothetical protein
MIADTHASFVPQHRRPDSLGRMISIASSPMPVSVIWDVLNARGSFMSLGPYYQIAHDNPLDASS